MNDLGYYIRQTGLVDPAKLDKKITVIGAGGIGSWTVLALLKMGCSNVTVVDFDTVEKHNIGSQLYGIADIGKTKVQAVLDRVMPLTETKPRGIDNKIEAALNQDFLDEADIIISAVDNMETRANLFEYVKANPKIFIDGRMAGNAIEIYTIDSSKPEDIEFYKGTLFSDDNALPIACSMRAVIYNTFVVSGFITDIVGQIANSKTPPKEVVIDLANFALLN